MKIALAKMVGKYSRIVVLGSGLFWGQQSLMATVDVQPLNVTRGSSSVAPGGSLYVAWQIINNGSSSAGSSYSQVRITSSSSSYGNSANNVGSGVATGTIGAGATINQNETVTVPSTLAPGTYYVWVIADNTSLLTQTDVNNDEAVSASFTVAGTVDVQPLNVTRGSSSVAPGGSLYVAWQIINNGSSSAGSSYSQVRITSSSSSYGNSANNVGSGVATGTIGAGATINQNETVTVPSTLAPGTYYVWVIADNTSLLTQTDVNNDEAVSASFTVAGTVDVQPLNVTRGSSSVAPGGSLYVAWQIINNGSSSAGSSYSQVRITSSSSSYGNSANNVGSGVATGTIGAGATINQNETVTVPSTLAPGTYYVWVIADNTSLLTQTDVNNDEAVSASFTVAGTVDVQPLNVTRGSSSVAPGGSLYVAWQIINNGSSSAGSSYSQVRITSSSSSYGNSANNVGSGVATGTIGAGATINQNETVTVPSTLAPGTYYVWVIADNTSLLTQTDVNNDEAVSASFTVTGTLPTTLQGADFNAGAGAINWPEEVSSGPNFLIVKASQGGNINSFLPSDMSSVPAISSSFTFGCYDYADPDEVYGNEVSSTTVTDPSNAGQVIADAQAAANVYYQKAGPYLTAGHLAPVLDLEDDEGSGGFNANWTWSEIAEWATAWTAQLQQDDPTLPEPILYMTQYYAGNLASLLDQNKYKLWIAIAGGGTQYSQPVIPPPGDSYWNPTIWPWVIEQYQTTDTAYPPDLDAINPSVTLSSLEIQTTTGGGGSAPVISNPTLTGTTFTLSVPTQAGTNYVLEYKNSMSDPSWTPIQTNSGNGAMMNMTNLGTVGPSRFYRVRLQ